LFLIRCTHALTLGQQNFKAGTRFGLLYGAANHDPAVILNPDVFDVSRRAQRHLSFAQRAQLCLGQHLARLSLGCFSNAS
jgi:cytochrome P450